MRIAVMLFALLLLSLTTAAQPPDAPVPVTEGAFFTGEYRNMLGEWGVSDEEIQARIDEYWEKLFYGDDETERIYYPVGDDMAYIADINNDDVRTEGMSYGMMLAVQLDKKEEFDRLWKWARTYMYRTEGQFTGYFCWHAFTDGFCKSQNPASDGEVWYTTALLFAAARWGNGEGIFNYEAEANAILDTMLHTSERTIGAADTFDDETKLVVFVAQQGTNSTFTDPSYQAPHYYELWARWAEKDNDFWTDAVAAARQLWRDAAHPDTGLMANYTTFEGEPKESGDYGGVYYADAWRLGMMIGMDWSWFAADPWQIEWADTYQKFFHDMGIGAYTSRFLIDGTPEGMQHRSGGHIAMNAVASLAATDPRAWDFIEEFWETPVPSGRYRYYDGLLQFFALLQLSGNFRIYDPTAE